MHWQNHPELPHWESTPADLKAAIRSIPDYPKPGIVFRDITTLLSDGEAFRRLRIPVSQVQSSVFNRAVETGALMNLGEVTVSPDFSEGGLVVTPIENNRRAQALRKLAATVPPAGTNIVVVTHKPNILDAFGKEWFDVREGEASVFQPGGGGYKLIVRVQADEWGKLAQAAPN